jgi:hypothetical protein
MRKVGSSKSGGQSQHLFGQTAISGIGYGVGAVAIHMKNAVHFDTTPLPTLISLCILGLCSAGVLIPEFLLCWSPFLLSVCTIVYVPQFDLVFSVLFMVEEQSPESTHCGGSQRVVSG